MHNENLDTWRHDHTFAQDQRRRGESRTLIVIAVTVAMMAVEIYGGIVFGSMALLADGLHMGSHAAALGITAFAYAYARRHAASGRFSFGTGKVNALGGFTGAVVLALFALVMAGESVMRLVVPAEIVFDQAILVAIAGLMVNAICALVLGGADTPSEPGDDHGHHHDHNLRSAYLHVIADALTSLLAIVALLAGKFFGMNWMDPMMGIVGAILVAWWSCGLIRSTAGVLLDRQAPQRVLDEIRSRIESDDDSRVTDLHVWSIGTSGRAALVSLVAHAPAAPAEYKARLPKSLGLAHVSIEVETCVHQEPAA